MFPKDDVRVGIFDVTESGSDLKKEFLKGILVSKENYYVRTVSNDYLAIFDQLYRAPGINTNWKAEDRPGCSIGAEFASAGMLPESKYKRTYFFRRKAYWAMMTSWDVEGAGARVSFPKYLVNDKVGERELVTVLAVPTSDKLRRAVWKTIWHKGSTLFELYIETATDPSLTLEFDYSNVVDTVKSSKCLP